MLGISGCASTPLLNASLYQRLGGDSGIEAVVDDLTNKIAADNRIKHFFADTDIADFKHQLRTQLCQATGGECVYEGADMLSAHEGLGITANDFSALVEDLIKTLNKFGVPATEQNELLGLLAPMKGKIVEQKPKVMTAAVKQTTPIAANVIPNKAVTVTPPIKPQKIKNKKAALKPTKKTVSPKKQTVKTKQASTVKTKTKVKAKPSVKTKAKKKKPIKTVAKKVPTTGQIKGQIKLLGANTSDNISIALEPLGKSTQLTKHKQRSHVVILKKKIYLPSHMSVQRGDKVAFHNLDKIKHNVFSVTQGSSFDLGTFRTGKRPATTMRSTGVIKVYCDIHPKMAMFVMVTDSPFHSVTNKKGGFSFANVPAGRYKLFAWNIRGETTRTIEIVAGKSTSLNITLDTRSYKPKPHLKKNGKSYPIKNENSDDSDEEYF